MFSPLRAVLLASAQYRAARASWSAGGERRSVLAWLSFPESAASSRTVTVELLRYCISNPFSPTPVLEHPAGREAKGSLTGRRTHGPLCVSNRRGDRATASAKKARASFVRFSHCVIDVILPHPREGSLMEINRQREKSAHHFMSFGQIGIALVLGIPSRGPRTPFPQKVTTSGPAVSSLVSNLVALPARWWRCDAANRPAGRGPPTHAHTAI